MSAADAVCDECGSGFIRARSAMAGLCAECAHRLYGYPPCPHDVEAGRCVRCGWDGSVSQFLGPRAPTG
jgi:NMD protein affecting ribosome stability and mRNA decay